MFLLAILLIALVFFLIIYDSKKSGKKMKDDVEVSIVEVSNFNMPFLSMVMLMVKWAIASIPALFILWVLFMVFGGIVSGLFRGLGHM